MEVGEKRQREMGDVGKGEIGEKWDTRIVDEERQRGECSTGRNIGSERCS